MEFKHRTYVIFGLARTGMAAVTWLKARGANVIALDNDSIKQQQASSLGAKIMPADNIPWDDVTALVQSPGIPHHHSVTEIARRHNVDIINDFDLFRQGNPGAKIIGITGTNGKSTTTTLVGYILNQAGIDNAIGGNVGIPVLSLPELASDGYYVFELSSFQLEVSHQLNLNIIGWLNVSEDHLDRHGNMADYIKAKERIFNHEAAPKAVIGIDDSWSENVFHRRHKLSPNNTISVSMKNNKDGSYHVRDHTLYRGDTALLDLSALQFLRGSHNYQNIAIAWGICHFAGLSDKQIKDGVLNFPGLAHRQEFVRLIDGITFINDSKATNADAAAKALDSFDNILWLAGGQPKSDGINTLRPYFAKIQHAYLFGQAQDQFAATLEQSVAYSKCHTLAQALDQAYLDAQQAKTPCVIILSPACASFDQFRDFEHRGDTFRELVLNLKSTEQA